MVRRNIGIQETSTTVFAEAEDVGLQGATTVVQQVVREEELRARIGEVSATPTANTVQDRLRTLGLQHPASLGQKTMAGSLSVTVASDQGALSVDTELPAAVALSDALPNPTVPGVGAYLLAWNGATSDRQRNNTEGTLLASAARTASTFSANQTNYNARGVILGLNVTVIGTGSVSVRMYPIDPAVGNINSPLGSSIAVTATGRYQYVLYPGVAAPATGSMSTIGAFSLPLPRQWQAGVIHTDGSSWTYSLSFAYIV